MPQLRIYLIASGGRYQRLAAVSGATFSKQTRVARAVTVCLPEGEEVSEYLRKAAGAWGFAVTTFPFRVAHAEKFTAQLKCQALSHIVGTQVGNDPILIADADTVCFSYPQFTTEALQAAASGRLGFVKDLVDRHTDDLLLPWYVPSDRRVPYVNSGVVLTGRNAADFFSECARLASDRAFLTGPFNDQKIINYLLCLDSHRSFLLDGRFNRFWPALLGEDTVIGHLACGAEDFLRGRMAMQLKLARSILGREPL